MRAPAYLIPPLFFLIAFAAMEGSRDLELAAMQGEASVLTIKMNRLSRGLSGMVQDVSLGVAEYDELQDEIDRSNAQIAELQEDLDEVWSMMDETEIKAARDGQVRRLLKGLGISSAVLALIIMGGRRPETYSYCLVATSILLGCLAV